MDLILQPARFLLRPGRFDFELQRERLVTLADLWEIDEMLHKSLSPGCRSEPAHDLVHSQCSTCSLYNRPTMNNEKEASHSRLGVHFFEIIWT